MTFLEYGFESLVQTLGPLELGDALAVADRHEVKLGTSFFLDQVLDIEEFAALAKHETVLKHVATLLGGPPVPYYSHLIVTAQGGIPITANWHKDQIPRKGFGVKAHFYLTDIDSEKDGPVRVAPRSWPELLPPEGPGIPVYAKRGDVLLTRPDLWHRSTPVALGAPTRKSLHVSYRLA